MAPTARAIDVSDELVYTDQEVELLKERSTFGWLIGMAGAILFAFGYGILWERSRPPKPQINTGSQATNMTGDDTSSSTGDFGVNTQD